MAESVWQPFREAWQHLKAMVTAGAGKLGVETGSTAVEQGALMGAASATSGTIGSVVLYGGFGVVSAVVNQIEYGAARGRIADFYHEELAAKLGKPKTKVVDDDIDVLAKGHAGKSILANQVIDEQIRHEKKIRNLGIGASFVASLSVFTLMHALLDGIGAAAIEAVAPGAGAVVAPLALSVATTVAKVIIGVLAYTAIKRPLMNVGKSFFGLDQDTTHDLIVSIAKDREHGKAITREQVVEVFIRANPHIAEYVAEHYGAEYHQLPLAEKVRVSADLAAVLPADKIAHNINLGTASASELAFTVQGDVSGVRPKAPGSVVDDTDQKSLLGRISHKCRNMVKAFNHALHPEKARPITTLTAINHAQKKHENAAHVPSPIVELNEPEQRTNHAEEITRRRANQVMMPATQTIH